MDIVADVTASTSAAPGALTRLDVRVEQHQGSPCTHLGGKRLRLNWYGSDAIAEGAVITATVRLKRPWGMRNLGGFDYERWLLANGYAATGYIRNLHRQIGPGAQGGQGGKARREPDFGQVLVNRAVIDALAYGAKDAIDPGLWELLRRTGTVHLMVISGLHLSVLGGIVFLVVGSLLRLCPAMQGIVAIRAVAATAALSAVWGYAAIAGLGAPVLRASFMATALGLAALTNRSVSLAWILALTAGVVLAVEPKQIAQQGFWLSFVAVAFLLLFFAPRRRRATRVRTLVAGQAVLAVGLAPVLSALGNEVPFIGAAANLVVVPIMSVLIVPTLFVAVLFRDLFGIAAPLQFVDLALSVVIGVLSWFDGWELGTMGPRYFGYCATALVETISKRLLVDTGPMFATGFNAADAAIIPTLRKTGREKLDLILVTHQDNDHSGGLAAVQHQFGEVPLIETAVQCIHAHWEWDGVRFATRIDRNATSENGRSCTLLIESHNAKAYLSGDIDKRSEQALLARLPRDVDLLIAPHHGSRTSSSWRFLRHLNPGIVIFPAGRSNRYGHPHPEVVRRYAIVGARASHTGHHGAVVWRSWRPSECDSERGFRCSAYNDLFSNVRNAPLATSR